MPLRPVLLAAMLVVAPLGVRAADLVVWWEKEFYAQEDEAVRETATGEGVPLGSGFHEVTGGLTAVKSQDPLVFVGGLSYTYAFEADGVRLGDSVALSVGTALAASPETSLRFFLDQSFVLDETEVGGQDIPGSDDLVSLLTIGASSVLSPRVLLDIEVGIGLTESAPEYTVSVAIPIRFNLPFLF